MKFAKFSFGLTAWVGVWGVLLGLASGLTWADEPLLPPQIVIQQTSDELQKTLQKPEYKKDFVKATQWVETVIDPHVDFDRVSMLILGKYWKTASPDQQVRFKKEFRMLLVRTYTTAFTEYANWTIRHRPMKMDPAEKRVVVRTEIMQAGAQPVAVDYRMANVKGDWKVYDVVIEGISLIQNYRTSFTNQVAQTGSLDQLIAEIAQRNKTALKEPLGDNASSGKAKSS